MKLLETRLSPMVIRLLDYSVVALTFVIVNLTAITGMYQFPLVSMFSGTSWLFVPSLGMVLFLIVILIWQNRLWHFYKATWLRHKGLMLFVFLALLSVFWTVYLDATLYKWLFLAFATIAGSYISIRFGQRGLMQILSVAATISIVVSFVLIWYFPDFGKLLNPVFNGAWRGVFWHRNHMGSLMAFFSVVLLYQLLDSVSRQRVIGAAIYGLFYFLSIILVFGSRSATGILLFIGLNVLWWLGVAWVKLHHYLRKNHYYLLIGAVVIVGLVVLLNLNNIFGLLGRESTLTGRTPLWRELIFNIAAQRPLLGYGYGGYWMVEQNRLSLQSQFGWAYPVFFADNGFIDILLGLGITGLVVMLFLFGQAFLRSVRYLLENRTLYGLLPLMTLFYVLSANLTYSFLLEVDQFVWMLFIFASFGAVSGNHAFEKTT